MIPRIFVSSTYYDLRHVRERLEKFIDSYGFEPILFESDKVTYQHGKEMDLSAYHEVGLCHVMVLIIGGRYGSPSSQTKIEEERRKYDEDYISITRKEFETAAIKNIPVLIFVDKNVYSEYQTYKGNQEFFEGIYQKQLEKEDQEIKQFKFAHVDHVNVFKFIDMVRTKPIKPFEKVEEIENYIKIQFSGMFYLYLESLKKVSEESKVLDTVSELKKVTLMMNEMLNSVGKEILGNDKGKYEEVIDNQFTILLDFFCEKFANNIEFVENIDDEAVDQIDLRKAAEVIYEKALICSISKVEDLFKDLDWLKKYRAVDDKIVSDLQKELMTISEKLRIKKFDYRALNRDLQQKVLPFMNDVNDREKLIICLKDKLYQSLTGLPF